ncbi:MAG: hypothetical protein K1Y36_28030 [Blastocatellia bacterium]|nr:hypothetical protein [Blastocatellia bacterium]
MFEISIRLFGQFACFPATVPHDSRPGKQLDVLCYLLLNRQRMVSRDELIDIFWEKANPEHARKRVWSAFSTLEKMFHEVWQRTGTHLSTQEEGFQLRMGP